MKKPLKTSIRMKMSTQAIFATAENTTKSILNSALGIVVFSSLSLEKKKL
jgi:hypothetical protein